MRAVQCSESAEQNRQVDADHNEYLCEVKDGKIVQVCLCLEPNIPSAYRIKVVRGCAQETITLPKIEPRIMLGRSGHVLLDAKQVLLAGYSPFLSRSWQQCVPLKQKQRLVEAFLALDKDEQKKLLANPRLFAWGEYEY
ncbi:hypothetical protein [Azonexus hydrophilus]|uniref:Uncharacterized protein n=1 Tax=Azonexus hydrophilus TaxID=418702 RepID=A0ABZ2XLC5_9RHOO